MPEKSNKKIIAIFIIIFILILAALSIFIAIRLINQNSTTSNVINSSANKTKIGGNIYCIGSDGNKIFALNTGKIKITDSGKYPVGASAQSNITVLPNQDGSWSADVDWENAAARYNVAYELNDTTSVMANGVKLLDMKNKNAVNCASPSKIGSTNGTDNSTELKPACVDLANLCPSETDKTAYNECKLNGVAPDKKNGYKGFDFVFSSCGNPVSTDVSLKLSTNSVFLPASEIELVATIKNNSKDKMDLGDFSPVVISFADTTNYLDSFDITCTSSSAKTDCGKISDINKGEYKMNLLAGSTEYQVTLRGKLKSSLKLLDKISINVEAKLATGYVDTDYADNVATIEKTITVDGKQCSDSKSAWDTNVCWGNVKTNDNGFYYFDDCKKDEICDSSFKNLTESQLCMYFNWMNNSKPNINGCLETSTVVANKVSESSAASSILTVNLASSSSKSSVAAIIPAATSSSKSSVSSKSSSSVSSKSSSSSTSSVSRNEKLPSTALEPTQILAWFSIMLIALGFMSYKFFFAEINYGKIDNIRFEVKKNTYLTKISMKEKFQTSMRKVKWESNYAINKAIISIKKIFK
ncbi:MAG: hypothetical protein WCK31_01185 [bacterium]